MVSILPLETEEVLLVIPKSLDSGEVAGSPEKSLQAAILRRAIFDALGDNFLYRRKVKNLESPIWCDINKRAGARGWFFSPMPEDETHFSFRQICESLDIEPSPILDFLSKNEFWPEVGEFNTTCNLPGESPKGRSILAVARRTQVRY